MKEYNVGDMVYSSSWGLGQIIRKRQVHKYMINYDVYWFEDGREAVSMLPETISYYARGYKVLVRRNEYAKSQDR